MCVLKIQKEAVVTIYFLAEISPMEVAQGASSMQELELFLGDFWDAQAAQDHPAGTSWDVVTALPCSSPAEAAPELGSHSAAPSKLPQRLKTHKIHFSPNYSCSSVAMAVVKPL